MLFDPEPFEQIPGQIALQTDAPTDAPMTERKYAMTRLAAGDYLLPSNDAQTLWRITRYAGSGGDDQDGWALYRWMGALDAVDIADWERWHYYAWERTRAEVIAEAIDWPPNV